MKKKIDIMTFFKNPFENSPIGALRSHVKDNKRIFYQRTEKGWKFFQEEDYVNIK